MKIFRCQLTPLTPGRYLLTEGIYFLDGILSRFSSWRINLGEFLPGSTQYKKKKTRPEIVETTLS